MSRTNARITSGPSPRPCSSSSAMNRSIPGVALAEPVRARVLGVVGDEVGLDEPDRLAVEQDDVEVDRAAALDRREVVLDDLLVGLVRVQPAPHVLALEPLVEQRQVGLLDRRAASTRISVVSEHHPIGTVPSGPVLAERRRCALRLRRRGTRPRDRPGYERPVAGRPESVAPPARELRVTRERTTLAARHERHARPRPGRGPSQRFLGDEQVERGDAARPSPSRAAYRVVAARGTSARARHGRPLASIRDEDVHQPLARVVADGCPRRSRARLEPAAPRGPLSHLAEQGRSGRPSSATRPEAGSPSRGPASTQRNATVTSCSGWVSTFAASTSNPDAGNSSR